MMDIRVPKGKYILAVSGGVDSMVLLDLLSILPGVGLVVAHFNHGIRPDSALDEELVREAAHRLGLPFESGRGRLGPGASEAAAREARYKFLYGIQKKHTAAAIITAHHQDDLIETALLNLLRGTGRRGLVAMLTNQRVLRPLLGWSKLDIIAYAKNHNLNWREDPSNQDETYLRNHLRKILKALTDSQKKEIISNIDKVAKIDKSLNLLIATLSRAVLKNQYIDRSQFISLPSDLGDELMLHWLKDYKAVQPQKRTVKRLSLALRTAQPGTAYPVSRGLNLEIGQKAANFAYTL